jgi:hypothetical protein
MNRLYVAMGHGLGVISASPGGWRAEGKLVGKRAYCVAFDPGRRERVYCGTEDDGLWRSDDAGETWQPVGPGIASPQVMAVAVSPIERVSGYGVVWAGTEPSALFRSEDGGATWQERPALKSLPSAPTWRFPPRPWTHHVRWIQPDPVVADRLYVAIELGGVMRSLDGGLTWEDRKAGAEPDAHTLRCHRLAPGRVYEAAGGGFAESFDAGTTWVHCEAGLPWHYLWGLAVDSADPNTMVLSVSPGPGHAHGGNAGRHPASASPPAVAGGAPDPIRGPGGPLEGYGGGPPPWAGYAYQGPEAAIYRRSGPGPWEAVSAGLPTPRGTLAYAIAAPLDQPHVFYAAPHLGQIYRSGDAGCSWEALGIAWPADFQPGYVSNLTVSEL